MDKTEILDIVNEPSKHIQIAKIVGEDRIVYSSKFVELLELIPTMLTKADVISMLDDLRFDLQEAIVGVLDDKGLIFADEAINLIQQKIDEFKEIKD